MKLFVCMLLVTMVVAAMLIDDSEAATRRRRSRRRRSIAMRSYLTEDQGLIMREVVEEARSVLDDLADETEELDARELEDLEEDDYARKRR
ncbi:Hypp504 [Branchiostoma lanceolatum]|uniref:Hypp504 protein n=1 Tax=Branchiostoma lanceolatum TaxID=7740 RepID=A0A8J9VAC4_BRALA|nr:Hypp504 [Branchiostoma lanceolatum]